MKKGSVLLLVICVFWFPASGLADDDQSWVQVKAPLYGFSVSMPELPEEDMSKKNFSVGTVVNHVYICREDQAFFKVDVSQLPPIATSFLGRGEVFERTRSGILSRYFGKQTSWKDSSLGKIKAKMLTYETPATDKHPAAQGKAYVFLQGDDLYVVQAELPKSQLPGESEKFFSSFLLIGKK